MLEERGKNWGERVRIIGLSIDNTVEIVKTHIESEAKKWYSVEHYHVRAPDCTAEQDYGVQGIPHALLIDKLGKIVFMGHPASRELEKDIEALLKGEIIVGEGTSSDYNSKLEPQIDESKVTAATSEFIKNSKSFMKANSEECSKLMRGLVVLVDESSYDVKT